MSGAAELSLRDHAAKLADGWHRQTPKAKHREFVWTLKLTKEEATAIFADVLGPYLRRLPLPVQWIMPPLSGLNDVLKDPKAAAGRHPVLEIQAA